MATNSDVLDVGPDKITPQFNGDFPPLMEQLLPPLTPEQEEEVDRLMTELPEYKAIMQSCRDLKEGIVDSSAHAVVLLKMIRDGKITPEQPELWQGASDVIAAASKAALTQFNILKEINQELQNAGLPVGDCAIKTPEAVTPAP